MAAATKRTVSLPSLSSMTPTPEHQFDWIVDPQESTDVAAGDACKLTSAGFKKAKGSDVVFGFAATTVRPGREITVYSKAIFGYLDEATTIDPGTVLYLSASVDGGLDTTPAKVALGFVLTNGNILLEGGWNGGGSV